MVLVSIMGLPFLQVDRRSQESGIHTVYTDLLHFVALDVCRCKLTRRYHYRFLIERA
jgi:hypothetical protein